MAGTGRDTRIDFLRAACILYIVGYWHLVPYTRAFPGYANFITEAVKDTALGTFVFCSGYLLAHRDVTLTLQGLWSFYQRRVARIYPLYLLALLIFAAVGLVTEPVFLNAALLVSMFNPPAPYTLWFVTMIMAFYLIAPFLIHMATDGLRYLLLGGGMFAAIVLFDRLAQPIDARMAMFLPAFVFGIAFQRHARFQAFVRRHGLWLFVLLIPAYWLFAQQSGAALAAACGRIPLVLVATAIAFLYSGRVATWFHGPTVLWLSYASFGLYLFHRPVFETAIHWYFPVDGAQRLVYLLAVALPATLALSWLAQTTYDRGLVLAGRLIGKTE